MFIWSLQHHPHLLLCFISTFSFFRFFPSSTPSPSPSAFSSRKRKFTKWGNGSFLPEGGACKSVSHELLVVWISQSNTCCFTLGAPGETAMAMVLFLFSFSIGTLYCLPLLTVPRLPLLLWNLPTYSPSPKTFSPVHLPSLAPSYLL